MSCIKTTSISRVAFSSLNELRDQLNNLDDLSIVWAQDVDAYVFELITETLTDGSEVTNFRFTEATT